MQLSTHPIRKPSRKSRNLSLRKVQDPQKPTILPPITPKPTQQINSTLIAEAQRRLHMSEQSLATDGKAHFKIDGGYGDYAMGVFRVKDRKRWIRDNIPKLFDNGFKAKIMSCFPPASINESQLDEIINKALNSEPRVQKQQPAPVEQKTPQEPLSLSRIQQIQDNMNGYLQIKYTPNHQIKANLSSFVSPEQTPPKQKQNNVSAPSTNRPRRSSRIKDKGYMFKALGRLKEEIPST